MKRARVLLCAAGVLLIGYGAWGLLTPDRAPAFLRYLALFGLGIVGHDLLLAPVAIAVGALVARWTPPSLKGPIRGGLFVSLAVTLVALPFALGYGYRPDVPSALPYDYSRGLVVTLAGIWLGVAAVALLRAVRRRRHPNDQNVGGSI